MYFRETIFWSNLLAAHKLPYHEEQEFCLTTTLVLATLTKDLALTLSVLSRNRYLQVLVNFFTKWDDVILLSNQETVALAHMV